MNGWLIAAIWVSSVLLYLVIGFLIARGRVIKEMAHYIAREKCLTTELIAWKRQSLAEESWISIFIWPLYALTFPPYWVYRALVNAAPVSAVERELRIAEREKDLGL